MRSEFSRMEVEEAALKVLEYEVSALLEEFDCTVYDMFNTRFLDEFMDTFIEENYEVRFDTSCGMNIYRRLTEEDFE